ncbi:MAG: hypothetical protein COU32_00285 [Candidatus Magasanikbacteria bacterium CG10_big_fil_rev_8_21_14_0_10_42_10]|uniref:Uncharacterized protein n=2 Tax=Candidatus Magasanikiibacteriota TaxID=1752731 RepID=A0A2H0TX86_9BACT|nr:MAG: hypothetical protein COU32_00285 [Candidatus Magasanikbacteria bacterium CG10_big_fil_rev_8_21_14_0_10_42_10]PIZ92451.1 MAG: hypothetical protein COX82_04740 [Candidatus Magasanikbacteria bacterium CG_4_10_14_0_2_um_filter_41_10]
MDHEHFPFGIVLATIVLTSFFVGGIGIFFVQQSSINILKQEMMNLQQTQMTTLPPQQENVQVQKTMPPKNEVTPTTQMTLPPGVEWMTYSDTDISFLYPKTFIGTPLQEDSDKDRINSVWEIRKEEHSISLYPNFQSPLVEFGAYYEIQLIKDATEAKNFHQQLVMSGASGKNLCQSLSNPIAIAGYTVCKYEELVDEGLGRVGTYYALLPEVQSAPSVFIFDQSGGMYTTYIQTTLLSSMNIK